MTKTNFLDPTESDRPFYADCGLIGDKYEDCPDMEAQAKSKRQQAYNEAEVAWLCRKLQVTDRPTKGNQ